MKKDILDYFGNSHASHIHARGKLSTNKLSELLKPQENEKILEVGFGTGATLIQNASQSKAEFFGYDMSPIMHQKALKRIKFCGMTDRISLSLLEKKNHFPAENNTFVKVYAESIIAIQEAEDFKNLFLEIKRVLKPNGVLLFNETIWLDTTSKKTAENINEQCKKAFGIIQANHEYAHLRDWKKILIELDFKHELEIQVDEIVSESVRTTRPMFRSNIFTLLGKLKLFLSPSMRRNKKKFQTEMNSIINSEEKLMEGVIIKVSNHK